MKLYKFFNYNFIKIIKDNIKNNTKQKITKKEKLDISNLIIKKEICAQIFVVVNFLITYISMVEMYKMTYQNNIFIYILKDNLLTSLIWFIVLSILPLLTAIMVKKNLKSKHYIILLILYIISNIYNILLIMYFILAFVNTIILGVIGILNIIATIIVNINIIIKIKENYLK